VVQVPILEVARRKNHIDMIDHSHGLLPIAVDCLNYQENERPSSEELCQRLADLKETREYRESEEQGDVHLAEIKQEILHSQSEIRAKDVQIAQLTKKLHQLSHRLGEQEQATVKVQLVKHSRERQVEQLQRKLSQQIQHVKNLSSLVQLQAQRQVQQDSSTKERLSQPQILRAAQVKTPPPPKGQLVLGEWREGGKAPFKMARGHAVVAMNVAYFMNFDGKGCSYDLLTKLWSKLPECPNMYIGLVVIRGLLTAIGGGKGLYHPDPESKLLSLRGKKWVERFPAMPTKRYSAAAVTQGQYLIVAGGQTGMARYLNTVEVMNTEALTWSVVASLPKSLFWASGTVCGDRVYVLGGFDKNDNTTSMLTCSLEALLHSCGETSCDSVWQRIADVPVHLPTCVAINEDLVAVGGRNERKETTAAVYKYNPTVDSWNLVSYMPTGRYDCLVTLLPSNEMIVVGGHTPPIFAVTDKVEIAAVTYLA
jgi:hypothetical protein